MAVVAVAALALIIGLATRPGEVEDRGCLTVDSSLSELLLSRPSIGPLETFVSVAEEVAPQGAARAYEHYYVIAMQFSTTDGSMHEGVWELGMNGSGPRGGTVGTAAAGASESIISINREAQSFTLWPRNGGLVNPLSESVIRARTCLNAFTNTTL
ncbi:hypothetical protein CH293_19515 [Rhodococcus sp. 14-2470-1b]|nr:hypothetical protein CH293_19515 [Rhodococcus sp. 14-2470-1b]